MVVTGDLVVYNSIVSSEDATGAKSKRFLGIVFLTSEYYAGSGVKDVCHIYWCGLIPNDWSIAGKTFSNISTIHYSRLKKVDTRPTI